MRRYFVGRKLLWNPISLAMFNGGVKEKDMGLAFIDRGSKSIHKVSKDRLQGSSFPKSRDSHESSIIHKLSVGKGRVQIVDGYSFQGVVSNNRLNGSTKAFSH